MVVRSLAWKVTSKSGIFSLCPQHFYPWHSFHTNGTQVWAVVLQTLDGFHIDNYMARRIASISLQPASYFIINQGGTLISFVLLSGKPITHLCCLSKNQVPDGLQREYSFLLYFLKIPHILIFKRPFPIAFLFFSPFLYIVLHLHVWADLEITIYVAHPDK